VGEPVYLLEIAALAVAGMLHGGWPFREAVPGYEVRWPIGRVALGFGLLAALLWFLEPVHGELAVTSSSRPGLAVHGGRWRSRRFPCARYSWRSVAAHRSHPRGQAYWRVGQRFLIAALLMRVDCPLDERLHLLVWHALPVAGGTLLSAVNRARFGCGAGVLARRDSSLTPGTRSPLPVGPSRQTGVRPLGPKRGAQVVDGRSDGSLCRRQGRVRNETAPFVPSKVS